MDLKREAARRALDYVRDGMVLGLGSGSTTAHFIELLGARLRAGEVRDLVGVPTSEDTVRRARAAGIPLVSLAEQPRLDLAVDGADEIDPDLNLIKGLGKALLREKIVETQSARLVIIADESKRVARLGAGPLPVEVARFGVEVQVDWLAALSGRAELWCQEDGSPFVTDNGNYLVRCWFAEGIADAYALAETLTRRAGIVEHGLFLDMADVAIVAGAGGTRTLTRKR
jgi:ribose 5-phosphate isomerase A